MQLSDDDLSQLDEEELLNLPEEVLRRLSVKVKPLGKKMSVRMVASTNRKRSGKRQILTKNNRVQPKTKTRVLSKTNKTLQMTSASLASSQVRKALADSKS